MNRHYHIERGEDDICTVSFFDSASKETTPDGLSDWDADIYDMPVPWSDGLEENIRHNFTAWLTHARAYCLQRKAMERAMATIVGTLMNMEGETE